MSKCVYCHARKGKRPCPALGGAICTPCCGEHRLSRITCPADCLYLESNSDYQQKRAGERFAQDRREFYKELFATGGDQAAALFNLIEMVTFTYFSSRRDGQDGEVLAALQELRRSVSPIHIPPAPGQVFAEHLKKEYEAFLKHRTQQGQSPLDQQTATAVLERAYKFVTAVSGQSLQSQRFLMGLIGYIKAFHPDVADHLATRGEEGRILIPGQGTPGVLASPPVLGSPLPGAPPPLHPQSPPHPHGHRH
ncbi:MAG: hypothetical protein ACREI3_02790 [Nitrospirales bacterium]